MKIRDMRDAITSVYSGPLWRMKVQEMPDRQVIAIFKSMVSEGRLTENGKVIKRTYYQYDRRIFPKVSEPMCEQLTIWDFYDKDGKKE